MRDTESIGRQWHPEKHSDQLRVLTSYSHSTTYGRFSPSIPPSRHAKGHPKRRTGMGDSQLHALPFDVTPINSLPAAAPLAADLLQQLSGLTGHGGFVDVAAFVNEITTKPKHQGVYF